MPTRHIVLVRVPAGTTPPEVEQAFAPLRALVGRVPGLLSFHGGSNTSPENASQGYNYGFVMDFADAAARDAYLPHPLHQEAAAGLRAIREPGGVLVFDLDY